MMFSNNENEGLEEELKLILNTHNNDNSHNNSISQLANSPYMGSNPLSYMLIHQNEISMDLNDNNFMLAMQENTYSDMRISEAKLF